MAVRQSIVYIECKQTMNLKYYQAFFLSYKKEIGFSRFSLQIGFRQRCSQSLLVFLDMFRVHTTFLSIQTVLTESLYICRMFIVHGVYKI